MGKTVCKEVRDLAVAYILRNGRNKKDFADAAVIFGCSVKSIKRFVASHDRFGHCDPLQRAPGAKGWIGVPTEEREYLEEMLEENPTLFFIEMVGLLSNKFGVQRTEQQVSAALHSVGITKKVLERHARDQDPVLRAEFRTLLSNGNFLAHYLVFIDESHVTNRDAMRKTGWAKRGKRAFVRSFHASTNLRAGCSAIAAFSIEGIQAVSTHTDTVGGDEVIEFLKNKLLPICSPYPGPRSVLVLDGASVHSKTAITTLCSEHGVLVLWLPPYSYDFNPIELTFHVAKAYIRRVYGDAATQDTVAARMEEALWNSCPPEMACNLFEHCHISVTAQERAWAKR